MYVCRAYINKEAIGKKVSKELEKIAILYTCTCTYFEHKYVHVYCVYVSIHVMYIRRQ